MLAYLLIGRLSQNNLETTVLTKSLMTEVDTMWITCDLSKVIGNGPVIKNIIKVSRYKLEYCTAQGAHL